MAEIIANPFQLILDKLDEISIRLAALESKSNPGATRIPLKEFCLRSQISRPTAYAWRDRGLIVIEKLGGRNFVKSDFNIDIKKYNRERLT